MHAHADPDFDADADFDAPYREPLLDCCRSRRDLAWSPTLSLGPSRCSPSVTCSSRQAQPPCRRWAATVQGTRGCCFSQAKKGSREAATLRKLPRQAATPLVLPARPGSCAARLSRSPRLLAPRPHEHIYYSNYASAGRVQGGTERGKERKRRERGGPLAPLWRIVANSQPKRSQSSVMRDSSDMVASLANCPPSRFQIPARSTHAHTRLLCVYMRVSRNYMYTSMYTNV